MTSENTVTAVVIAVLPEYREHFVQRLRALTGGSNVRFYAGTEHLIQTVRTGASERLGVTPLKNVGLLGRRILWQRGALAAARSADVVITDLNPRSLSAWLILAQGKARGQRTLVWGHILPRAGINARTVPLRRYMRRMAAGVISYTWSDRAIVENEDPQVPVWVAANGLYPAEWLASAPTSDLRDSFLYVGRLVTEKKPQLLIEGYAHLVDSGLLRGEPPRLVIVGDGPERRSLEELATRLGVIDRISFEGHVSEFAALQQLYERAIASVSPGYVGLSLTQSLGFGVPMIVSRDEPHAPEYELFSADVGVHFDTDDPASLARAMFEMAASRRNWDGRRTELVELIRAKYSADAMADGFHGAIRGAVQ